jgi:hypothetical protein
MLKRGFNAIRILFGALLYRTSPVLLARFRYRTVTGRSLRLRSPVTFDEKLLWLMLYWRHPLKTRCTDKYAMRGFIEEMGFGHLLPGLYGVYEKGRDIDFAILPERFVLKATHGCGFNIICPDKKDLDAEAARRQLDSWLKKDFSRVYGEVHYAGIKPRIICEQLLDDGTGRLPRDFKLHCFHGRVHFTTVCSGRDPAGWNATYDHFDRDWRTKLPLSKSGLHLERAIPMPEAYPAMREAAEALSQPFPYVRMDFYSIRGSAVLGEMTFSPCGCIDTGYTEDTQNMLGGLIHLPERLDNVES